MLSTKAGKTHLSSRTPRSGVCGQCPPYRGHEYLVDHTIVLINSVIMQHKACTAVHSGHSRALACSVPHYILKTNKDPRRKYMLGGIHKLIWLRSHIRH